MDVMTGGNDAAVEERPRRRTRGALSWLGQVVSWLVVLSIGALLLVTLVVPRLAGATTYVVETGSMRPELPPGTLVAVRQVDPSTIAAGDVITYQLRSGDPTVVTHRVLSVGYDGAGDVRWQTKGDANSGPDRAWVLPEQVRGRLWYAVPYVGYATSSVSPAQRRVLAGLIAVGLAGYALAQWVGAVRDRRRKRPVEGGAGS